MAVLSVVLFSCVREEMTCDKELIVVQRIGEGGYVYTRGTVISSNTDLKEETFGLYGSLTPNASVPQPYFNASATVNADLILADEPCGNLDSRSGKEVMELLLSRHKCGKTVILITHSLSDAKYADRILTVCDGKLYK